MLLNFQFESSVIQDSSLTINKLLLLLLSLFESSVIQDSSLTIKGSK